jgi:hypothetical protein
MCGIKTSSQFDEAALLHKPREVDSRNPSLVQVAWPNDLPPMSEIEEPFCLCPGHGTNVTKPGYISINTQVLLQKLIQTTTPVTRPLYLWGLGSNSDREIGFV